MNDEWFAAVNRQIFEIYKVSSKEELFDVLLRDFCFFIGADGIAMLEKDSDKNRVFSKISIVSRKKKTDSYLRIPISSRNELFCCKKSARIKPSSRQEQVLCRILKEQDLEFESLLPFCLCRKEDSFCVAAFYSQDAAQFEEEAIKAAEFIKDHLALKLGLLIEDQPAAAYDELTRLSLIKGLTRQESRVLALLLEQKSYDQIAGALHISVNTAKKHTGNLYRKLGIHSRIQLFQVLKPEFDPSSRSAFSV